MRLVLRVDLHPECRFPTVPNDPDPDLVVLAEELEHHAGEAVEGVGGQPARRRDALRQRVERPVEQGVTIDEVDTHSYLVYRTIAYNNPEKPGERAARAAGDSDHLENPASHPDGRAVPGLNEELTRVKPKWIRRCLTWCRQPSSTEHPAPETFAAFAFEIRLKSVCSRSLLLAALSLVLELLREPLPVLACVDRGPLGGLQEVFDAPDLLPVIPPL